MEMNRFRRAGTSEGRSGVRGDIKGFEWGATSWPG